MLFFIAILILFILGWGAYWLYLMKDRKGNKGREGKMPASSVIENMTVADLFGIRSDEDKKVIESSHRIGIVSMIKEPKNIEQWLKHHRDMGILRFYIRLEETPDLVSYLDSQKDVVLDKGSSTGKNEYTEIQVRQKKMVDTALKKAYEAGDIDWLIHIDCDELLEGDLDEIRGLSPKNRLFWMENVEAVYEDIPEKADTCFKAATFRKCSDPSVHCVSYVNGKGGGRVATDVTLGGPHRFTSTLEEGGGIKLEKVVVKHYESCDFYSYKKKFMHLALNDDKMEIPFSYYNESIEAAKKANETGKDNILECVYEKHRTTKGESLQEDCLSSSTSSNTSSSTSSNTSSSTSSNTSLSSSD